jgi:hypothetical protein
MWKDGCIYACGVATRQTSERYVPHMMDVACVVTCGHVRTCVGVVMRRTLRFAHGVDAGCDRVCTRVLKRSRCQRVVITCMLSGLWAVGAVWECNSCNMHAVELLRLGLESQTTMCSDRAQRLVSLTRLVLFLRALMLRQPLGAPRRAPQPPLSPPSRPSCAQLSRTSAYALVARFRDRSIAYTCTM